MDEHTLKHLNEVYKYCNFPPGVNGILIKRTANRFIDVDINSNFILGVVAGIGTSVVIGLVVAVKHNNTAVNNSNNNTRSRINQISVAGLIISCGFHWWLARNIWSIANR